jgi:hypothetical protein
MACVHADTDSRSLLRELGNATVFACRILETVELFGMVTWLPEDNHRSQGSVLAHRTFEVLNLGSAYPDHV